MKRTISILLASLTIAAGPSMAGASASFDPNTSGASDSVPDPWTMFVDEVARDRGLTYDRAADEIGAWLRCMDGSCKPGVERWRRLALKAGWPESEWDKAACIIWNESRGDENVVYRGTRRNPEWSIGVFQMNTRGRLWGWYEEQGLTDRDELLDPLTNLRVGHAMWAERGWRPWGAARLCRHLR